MKRRSPWLVLGVAAAVAVFAILLLAGCESGTTIRTGATVDNSTHRATIKFHTTNEAYIVVLFLTYPDGRREMPMQGNLGSGGASLLTEELSPGNYTYTVYAIPQGNQDPESVPSDDIIKKGRAFTGKFTVP